MHPDLRHVGRLEGVWINYSEHGMSTSVLEPEARQKVAPLRRHVTVRFEDLVQRKMVGFGIEHQ